MKTETPHQKQHMVRLVILSADTTESFGAYILLRDSLSSLAETIIKLYEQLGLYFTYCQKANLHIAKEH